MWNRTGGAFTAPLMNITSRYPDSTSLHQLSGELSRLVTTAVVNQTFRHLLLTNPALAGKRLQRRGVLHGTRHKRATLISLLWILAVTMGLILPPALGAIPSTNGQSAWPQTETGTYTVWFPIISQCNPDVGDIAVCPNTIWFTAPFATTTLVARLTVPYACPEIQLGKTFFGEGQRGFEFRATEKEGSSCEYKEIVCTHYLSFGVDRPGTYLITGEVIWRSSRPGNPDPTTLLQDSTQLRVLDQ